MTEFGTYFFSDPFIRPSKPFIQPSNNPLDQTPFTPDVEPSKPEKQAEPADHKPQITTNLLDLKNRKIIVYRNSTPTSVCKGPNIHIPILNLKVDSAKNEGDFYINCVSTYPKQTPFSPIADRFEIRFFKDSFFLTLTDGCGLHPTSRLAPKAAIEGFWNYLAPKLQEDQEHFDIHKLGNYLRSAIKAAHFNIYWDAYARSQEDFVSLRENVEQVLCNLQEDSDTDCITEILKLRRSHLEEEIRLIQKALGGDLLTQKALVTKNLDTRFYEEYAGATTFMCSALLKASSGDYPYYLLTVNLGDGQCFILRDGFLMEMTKDTRKDLSNVRDPGGKIGLCSPVPLKMDERNMQFSLTPCKSEDLLLFMTDGVLDNLNPERLGLHPNGLNTPYWIQEKLREASGLEAEPLNELLGLLNLEETSWKEVSLETANSLKSLFVKKLLQHLILLSPNSEDANQMIIDFCTKITEGHREKLSSSNSYYHFQEPLGKPDHTTCLTYKVP